MHRPPCDGLSRGCCLGMLGRCHTCPWPDQAGACPIPAPVLCIACSDVVRCGVHVCTTPSVCGVMSHDESTTGRGWLRSTAPTLRPVNHASPLHQLCQRLGWLLGSRVAAWMRLTLHVNPEQAVTLNLDMCGVGWQQAGTGSVPAGVLQQYVSRQCTESPGVPVTGAALLGRAFETVLAHPRRLLCMYVRCRPARLPT